MAAARIAERTQPGSDIVLPWVGRSKSIRGSGAFDSYGDSTTCPVGSRGAARTFLGPSSGPGKKSFDLSFSGSGYSRERDNDVGKLTEGSNAIRMGLELLTLPPGNLGSRAGSPSYLRWGIQSFILSLPITSP